MNDQLKKNDEATIVDLIAFLIRYRFFIIIFSIILIVTIFIIQFTIGMNSQENIIEYFYLSPPSLVNNQLNFSIRNEIDRLIQDNRLILSVINQYNSNTPINFVVQENIEGIQYIRDLITYNDVSNSIMIQYQTRNSDVLEFLEILTGEIDKRLIALLRNQYSIYQSNINEITQFINAYISTLMSIWIDEPIIYSAEQPLNIVTLILSINSIVLVIGSFIISSFTAFIMQIISNFKKKITDDPNEFAKIQKALHPKQYNDNK